MRYREHCMNINEFNCIADTRKHQNGQGFQIQLSLLIRACDLYIVKLSNTGKVSGWPSCATCASTLNGLLWSLVKVLHTTVVLMIIVNSRLVTTYVHTYLSELHSLRRLMGSEVAWTSYGDDSLQEQPGLCLQTDGLYSYIPTYM